MAQSLPLQTVSAHPVEVLRTPAPALLQPTTIVGRPGQTRLPANGSPVMAETGVGPSSRYVPGQLDQQMLSLPGRVRDFGKYLPADVRVLVEDAEQVKADFRAKVDADCDDVGFAEQIDKTVTDVRARFEKILEDLKIALYDRVFRFEESFLKYVERFCHATHMHLDAAEASTAGLEPDKVRPLYQTQFLRNPIDQQIHEGVEHHRLSQLLVDRLHLIRKNYEELQIEQMKSHIDQVMSSKPVCVDFKVLNASVDGFLAAVHAESRKLLQHRVVVNHDLLFAKPVLQRLVPVARAVPIKTAILSHRRVSPPITVVHHQPHIIIPAHSTVVSDFDAKQVRKPPSRTASLEKRPDSVPKPEQQPQPRPTLKRPDADRPAKKRVTYEDELLQHPAPVASERGPERDFRATVLSQAPAQPEALPQPAHRPEPPAEARPAELRQTAASAAPQKDPALVVSDDFVPSGSKTDAPLTLDNAQPQTSILSTLPVPAELSTPCSLNTIDKDRLAVGTVTGGVCIFDLPSNTFTSIQLAPAPVTVLRSLDSLLLAGQDTAASNVAIIDVSQKPPTIKVAVHPGAGVRDLHFLVGSLHSAAPNLFVSLSANQLGLWSRGGEQPRKVLEVGDQPLSCLAVFNGQKSLVVGGRDGLLRLFRAEEEELVFVRQLRDAAGVVSVDSFYNNSNFVISSNSRCELKIWDTASGE